MQVGNGGAMPWWSIASTVGAALATIAVGFFAAVELWATRSRRRERERSVSARIAATAYLARRQLRTWLGEGAGSPDALEEWIRDSQTAGSLATQLDVAEQRFVDLLSEGANADSELCAAAESAAVHFFEGANCLNVFVSTPRPNGIEIADWVRLRDDAWADFRDCVRLLDETVGASRLIQQARLVDAKRRSENPKLETMIAKLAGGLEKLYEQTSRKDED